MKAIYPRAPGVVWLAALLAAAGPLAGGRSPAAVSPGGGPSGEVVLEVRGSS
jgi:hypothetical protein